MGTGTLQMAAMVAAVALVAAAGVTFIATAGDSEGEGGGFIGHIHKPCAVPRAVARAVLVGRLAPLFPSPESASIDYS